MVTCAFIYVKVAIIEGKKNNIQTFERYCIKLKVMDKLLKHPASDTLLDCKLDQTNIAIVHYQLLYN